MGKLNKVDRVAKQKLHKATSLKWDKLKNTAAVKGYYRDQARIQLKLPRPTPYV